MCCCTALVWCLSAAAHSAAAAATVVCGRLASCWMNWWGIAQKINVVEGDRKTFCTQKLLC